MYLRDETGDGVRSVGITAEVGSLQHQSTSDRTYAASIVSIRHHSVPDDINILLSIPASVSLRPGQVVAFTGYVSAPDMIGTFDYPGYLQAQGIYGRVSPYSFTIVGDDAGWWEHTIEGLRAYIRVSIMSMFPPDTGNLLL